MKKSHFKMLFSFVFMALVMLSCENNLEMVLPQGPKGDKGDKGDPGKSAFELWLEHYGKDSNTSIEEFFNSLKGENGKDGAVPIIGENGNWIIDGIDTGIPARGKDGKDGVTPEIGDNGNWFIGGVDTGIPARGKDGFTPVIGENGNWWIDGQDTGKPSVVIPEIGSNGNWFIGGVDTGKPSRGNDGANGVNGKSAYELWKEAVDAGEMTNKDGSEYTGGNTWEEFLRWLQGGDVSVLYQYWKTLPGNSNKTIQQFIEELFSCHCDGITVSVIALNECVELNADGTVKGTHSAELRVGGEGGTQVNVTGNGINLNGIVSDNFTPVIFNIPRGNTSIQLVIACTKSGNTVNKEAVIPALNYVRLSATPTVVPVPGQQQDVVTVQFVTAPVEMSVDGTVVYASGAVVAGSGWAVSNEGRTFIRTYNRMSTEQKPTVRATGANSACSTIEEAFTIGQLAPVQLGPLALTTINECNLQLSVTGTPGMTVTAMDANNHAVSVVLPETSAGNYSTGIVPRLYQAYTILVRAELTGYGTVEETIVVDGPNLASELLRVDPISGVVENTSISQVQRKLTNLSSGPIQYNISRGGNVGANRHPLSPAFPLTGTIAAGSSVDLSFYRDYTSDFSSGEYEVTITVQNQCGLQRNYTLTIANQQNYRHAFTMPAGWGDGSGDPNEMITFEVSVFDGIPGSYVEFQLFNGLAYGGVSREQLDASGNLTWNVTMTRAQIQAALNNQKGYFYFYSNSGYTEKYSIGSEKEEVTFAFD
ncbi:hypothetical protein [Proteiniphilum sp.]|uniref:hypothetical protein n=1 Tax=Proteiniphilum sp. TaxID=1926877 RepID=UPI002B22028B|nr:hypothetical protein [Proteiniphilum sp.]MEA4916811.1 hypothetical protein [Proteiniphilum sp.]